MARREAQESFDSIFGGDWFENREEYDNAGEEEASEDYRAFVDKFKPKLTTDDCYTPKHVYEAIANWVSKRYGVPRERFVRPFYPGGDYELEDYPEGCAVVDNPPFSILAEIVGFYNSNRIPFFLFAPALTITKYADRCTVIAVGVGIIYENGADVITSFLTNMEDRKQAVLRSDPELYQVVKTAVDEERSKVAKTVPKYTYPMEICTVAMVQRYSKHGITFSVPEASCLCIDAMDAQKPFKKSIFGGGLLLSERAAAERAAAERAAAERAAAERAAAERAAAERAAATKWELSPREQDFVRWMSRWENQ